MNFLIFTFIVVLSAAAEENRTIPQDQPVVSETVNRTDAAVSTPEFETVNKTDSVEAAAVPEFGTLNKTDTVGPAAVPETTLANNPNCEAGNFKT